MLQNEAMVKLFSYALQTNDATDVGDTTFQYYDTQDVSDIVRFNCNVVQLYDCQTKVYDACTPLANGCPLKIEDEENAGLLCINTIPHSQLSPVVRQ
jgi:hypothetical protein